MRVLLVQAVSAPATGELVYPLGLARLARVLAGRHQLAAMDLNLDPYPWPALVRLLEDFRPQAVCISFRNLDPLAGNHQSWLPPLQVLARLLRRRCPRALLIAGGPGFSLFARRLMAEVPELDLGVAGEAEQVLPALLQNPAGPAYPAGVLHRRDGGVVGGGLVHLQSCRHLPAPDWSLFPLEPYRRRNRYVAFMGVESKRGCAYRCSYCLYPRLQGGRVRLRSPRRVLDELQALEEQGLELVHFTDPVLNQPARHLRRLCRGMLERGIRLKWTGFFREDRLYPRDLELYQRAGLAAVYFSADGASARSLELLHKDLEPGQVLAAAGLAAGSGLVTVYHFLVNLPGENQRSVDQGRRLLESILDLHQRHGNPASMVFNNLRLYPGTPLTRRLWQAGLVSPERDLLFPSYYNPPPWDGLRYQWESLCLDRQVEVRP